MEAILRPFYPEKPLFQDRWLRIIGIPLVALGMQILGLDGPTLAAYVPTWDFLIHYLYNVSVTAFLWQANRWAIYKFEQLYPFHAQPVRRIALQILLCLPLTKVLDEFLLFIWVKGVIGGEYWFMHWTVDFPVSLMLAFLLHLLYLLLFISQTSPSNHLAPVKAPEPEALPFVQGKSTRYVSLDEISLVEAQQGMVSVYTFSGEKLLASQSLQALAERLSADHFFQANRQYLIHRSLIRGYTKTPTRKLMLQLHAMERFSGEISVSKAKTPAFLSWLSASTEKVSVSP
ncbi:MAG: LytTR family DNA-binding domain-containing protein [Bacteroidota bacterium]